MFDLFFDLHFMGVGIFRLYLLLTAFGFWIFIWGFCRELMMIGWRYFMRGYRILVL
jgi:hypothetical protein